MIEIPLTQDRVTVIDDGDWALVKDSRWHAVRVVRGTGVRWYAVHGQWDKVRRLAYSLHMHRLLTGARAPLITDHIDGDGLNNRRGNLRVVTYGQNRWNAAGRKHIYLHRQPGRAPRYEIRVMANGAIHNGYARTEAEAQEIRRRMLLELHGYEEARP